jgi:hypothetical protein
MVGGSGSISPWGRMAPKPFAEEAAPQLLARDRLGLPVDSRTGRAGAQASQHYMLLGFLQVFTPAVKPAALES